MFLVEPALSGVFDPEDGQQTRLDKIIGTVSDAADTAIESVNDTVDNAVERVNKTASDAVESIGKAEESISESVTDARGSADAAANSANQAAVFASAGQVSERNAANSAMQASQSATAAKQSEDNAAESERNAASSVRNAASSAESAANIVASVSGSVAQAEAAAQSASQSATSAAGSASAAGGSAQTAADSASKAGESATAAGASERNAASSAAQAAQSATAAAQSASGTIAAADDSYSAPRQIRVHGETIENFRKFNDGKTAKPEKLVVHTNNFFPNIPGKTQNGITLTQDANGVYHMDGVSTINGRILWTVVASVPSGDYVFKHSASRSNIDGYINAHGYSHTTFRSSSAAGTKGSMTDSGNGFTFYIRCNGLQQGVEYHDTVQIVLASGTDIPSDFPKNESSEVALPSDLNLADGDTLVIDSDGSTQITHSSGEPTPSTPVTLPAIPAPTFAIYTKGGLTRPTVDVDYERNINIVINKLEQAIAVQAATMKVNQLTD